VRALHLRARRALAEYDRRRCLPTPDQRERHRKALERFLDCLLRQDAAGLEAILAESVRTVTDAAGEYTALATPLVGRARVARLYPGYLTGHSKAPSGGGLGVWEAARAGWWLRAYQRTGCIGVGA
jgi:hypothetical protein